MAQELITYGGDRRLVLANGQAVRALIYADTWNQIRIGIRLAFINTAATIGGGPTFAMGVCRGDTNVWIGGTSDHILGFRFYDTAGGGTGLTYNAGAPAYLWHNSTAGGRIFKRVGTTETDSSNVIGNWFMSADSSIRSGMFLQITKGSPNYDLAIYGPNAAAGAQSDLTDAQFLAVMEMNDITLISSVKANYGAWDASETLAVNEGTDGALDNFFIFWGRSAQQFSFDMKHRKIS